MAQTQISAGAILTIEEMLLQIGIYVDANISPATVSTQENAIEGIQETLINSLAIVNAYTIQIVLIREYALLQNMFNGAFPLAPSDIVLIQNRLNCIQQLIQVYPITTGIYPLPLWLAFDISLIQQGESAIIPYDLTGYLIAFDGEVPPALGITSVPGMQTLPVSVLNVNTTLGFLSAGTLAVNGQIINYTGTTPNSFTGCTMQTVSNTAVVSVGDHIDNMYGEAVAMATAFLNARDYVGTFGTSSQMTCYDALDRMYQSSTDAANFLLNADIDFNVNLGHVWNSLVAMPSVLRVASLLMNDPSDALMQSTNALRHLIILSIDQCNQLLASFHLPSNTPSPTLAKLHANESILSFAARVTGDYTQWQNIVALNALLPPYVGVVRAPGVAIPGDILYITGPVQAAPLSNYNTAFLGTDIDFNLVGSPDIPWFGDFALISGYNNLLGALARRVLTNLGSLIFESTYGSRLPSEIGNIRSTSEATLLSAYLQSALLSDPRIQTVSSLIAVPGDNDQTILTAGIVPYGQVNASPFNLVLTPKSGG